MSADLTTEVAVVGSGVAGALAAAKLAEAGIDVVILEAGPRITREAAVQSFAEAPIRSPDAPYPVTAAAPYPRRGDPDGYVIESGPDTFGPSYIRLVGGTTWHWLGACPRLVPDDFRMKSRFGRAVDWPIAYEDLEPWYAQAERALGVAGDDADDLGSPRSSGYPMAAMPLSYLDLQVAERLAGSPYPSLPTPYARNTADWNGRPPCCGAASCIPICPSGAKYDAMVHVARAEAAGARILERCVVHKLELAPDRRIASLLYRRPDRSDVRLRAKVFVLAAHGIETPKILFMSRGEGAPDGLANSSGVLGRFLMDHPYKLSWALTKEPLWPYRGPIRLSAVNSTRLGDRRARVPAFRSGIDNSAYNWPLGGPTVTVRHLIRQGLRGAALQQAILDQTSRQIGLTALTEQLPDPENRVVADFDRRDALGLPRPRLHFRLDDYTKAGLAEAERVHEAIFALIGTSETHHRPGAMPGGHIMGTTRMGDDPRSSVVDPSLRAHDHPNLFLLGSGAFPTGGAANPTLTIAALSLRAVEPIKTALRA
ncbi:MAG: GMC family oxidoreductase [Pseudomonadota bacterium]